MEKNMFFSNNNHKHVLKHWSIVCFYFTRIPDSTSFILSSKTDPKQSKSNDKDNNNHNKKIPPCLPQLPLNFPQTLLQIPLYLPQLPQHLPPQATVFGHCICWGVASPLIQDTDTFGQEYFSTAEECLVNFRNKLVTSPDYTRKLVEITWILSISRFMYKCNKWIPNLYNRDHINATV